MIIKALSIVKPWGTSIAQRHKTLEIRSWQPHTLPLENLLIVENERRLIKDGDTDPNGCAVAVVSIREVHAWTPAEAEAACSKYEQGWRAWTIEDVRPILKPFPVIAARKIYEVDVADEFLAGIIS